MLPLLVLTLNVINVLVLLVVVVVVKLYAYNECVVQSVRRVMLIMQAIYVTEIIIMPWINKFTI